jgi:hypothetical protein
MVTVLVVIFLICAIIVGILASFSPRHVPWVGLAVAFVAAAELVTHLGLH